MNSNNPEDPGDAANLALECRDLSKVLGFGGFGFGAW